MLYHCQLCGKPFKASPAAKRKFCSLDCSNQNQSNKVERTCQTCGKSFLVKAHVVKDGKGKFCSRACADYGWDEPCENCGKLVHRTPHHAKTQEHIFCSRRCYATWKSKKVELPCEQCGKPIKRKPSQLEVKSSFCSRQCYFDSKKQKLTTLICKQCGQPFDRPKSSINSNMYQGKYCSATCMGIARRLPESSRSIYNHEFTERLKKKIRQRDNYTCQQCGLSETDNGRNLDIHHINYRKEDCSHINLISLCRFCHPATNYNRDYWTKHLRAVMKTRY